jgi:predicted metalloprotease with PDZ domain
MISKAEQSVTRTLTAALALTALAGSRAPAQQLEPIRYVLCIPAPETHYVKVQATYPTSRKPAVELMMAVWTSGSYLVSEFARHVEEVDARDPAGRSLQLAKSRKNRWRVQTGGANTVVLTYRVCAHERQARTNWVEDSFAPD